MTAAQAAHAARQIGAKRLILTHFSQRYQDLSRLAGEARTVP
jgi:ribonuclease Z